MSRRAPSLTRRRYRTALATTLFLVAIPALADTRGAARAVPAVEEVRIEDQTSFWVEGEFVSLVPPVRLPTTHDRRDVIWGWLRVPAGASIGVERDPEGRPALVYPPGTRADRVEYLRLGRSDEGPEALTVTDVRGITVEQDGDPWFHVLRASGGEPHAPLVGWRWRRGDERAQLEATRRLLRHASGTRMPVDRPPYDEEQLERLRELNECGGCHRASLPPADEAGQRRPDRRGTDSLGLFLPQSVLAASVPSTHHRPNDLNSEDPYVEVRCGKEPATLKHDGAAEYYTCTGDEIPMGSRRIEAGMADEDPYTQAVCASRRRLHGLMDAEARQAFSSAWEPCGIS